MKLILEDKRETKTKNNLRKNKLYMVTLKKALEQQNNQYLLFYRALARSLLRLSDSEAKDLIPIIEKKVKKGNKISSDTWRAYTGLATKGYVHRIVNHGKKEYVKGKSHINGLEGFFGYLKR